MARIQDIIADENKAPANVIRLVTVNNGFLRAYNKSAWRFHTFINQYKLKRMYVKSLNQETVSLGFQEGSLHRIAEGRQLNTTDLGYDLILKPEEMLTDDAAYEQWFAAIPISNVSTADYDALPTCGADAEKEVLRLLRNFPLERRTPIECQSFLAKLRETLEGETNLIGLRDELINGIYKPSTSICFLVYEPKMREVFAADFRDRIVHHLFYNYTVNIFERSFIADSYSCIKGRSTHFGINRLKHHILSESRNYSKSCWVLHESGGFFRQGTNFYLRILCP